MTLPEDALSLALAQLQRLHADQLHLLDSIATRNGLMLGFSLTSLVAVASIGRTTLLAGAALSAASLAFLAPAVFLLSYCYLIRTWANAPSPAELIRVEEKHPEQMRRELVASLAHTIRVNRRDCLNRLTLVNLGFVWFVVGIFIYALGVGWR